MKSKESNCMPIGFYSYHCVSMTMQRYDIGEGAFMTFYDL